MSKKDQPMDPDFEGFEPNTEEQAQTASAPPADYNDLVARLNELEGQLSQESAALEQTKNQLVRNHAELENIRKRAEKDIQSAHKYGLERLINELLPVIDSLEHGMNIEIGDNEFAKNMHAGMAMTRGLMLKTLEKFSIKQVDPINSAFDPALHQAISMQEQAGIDANTVLQVLQKGYTLHDRLIRPALVVVAK